GQPFAPVLLRGPAHLVAWNQGVALLLARVPHGVLAPGESRHREVLLGPHGRTHGRLGGREARWGGHAAPSASARTCSAGMRTAPGGNLTGTRSPRLISR